MRLTYYIFSAVAWLVSILPFFILYRLSDLLYIIIYHLIGYRKKVTISNLHNAFPKKSDKEIKQITRKFYQNLADLIVEVIKIKSISSKTLHKRVTFHNYEIIEDIYKQNRSIFVAIGHCGNWEWMGLKMAMISKHKPFAIVKPLTDPYFEQYMNNLRTKSGYNNLIKFKQTYRQLLKIKKQRNIVIIASDQTPTRDEINYWTNFLNQETPFFLGLEKMSKNMDFSVLFYDIIRTKQRY